MGMYGTYVPTYYIYTAPVCVDGKVYDAASEYETSGYA